MRKKFAKVAPVDAIWLSQQPRPVQVLWFECIAVDQFGDKFQPFETRLEPKSFQRARKALSNAGYLEFDFKRSVNDQRHIESWLVRNMHGATTEFWEQDEELDGQPSPGILENSENEQIIDGQESPPKGQHSPSIGRESPGISSGILSQFDSCVLLDFNQTESDKLTNYHKNPSVSLVSDSLRSTQSTESSSKEDPSSSNETPPCPENLFYHQAVFLEEDTRTDYWHGKEMENRSSVQQHEGSVMSYITPQISRTFSAAENRPEAPSPDPTTESHTNHPQDALSDPLAPADETLDLEVELECLRETVEGVLWDINGTISPGLPEVLERFKSLATTTRLLPVSENCPEYERMNGFVEMKNYELVMSLSTNGEIKRVAFGHISYQ